MRDQFQNYDRWKLESPEDAEHRRSLKKLRDEHKELKAEVDRQLEKDERKRSKE
jgi:hypothetical protein